MVRRDNKEAKLRKEDKKKLKKRREDLGPDSIFNKKEVPEVKRSKLVLPEPQISEQEIEQVRCLTLLTHRTEDGFVQIVKVGRATDSVRTLAEGDEDTGTATLLSDVQFTPMQVSRQSFLESYKFLFLDASWWHSSTTYTVAHSSNRRRYGGA